MAIAPDTLDFSADIPPTSEQVSAWLERTLLRATRRLMDSENLDMPLLQLPLAQMRLAHALYEENSEADLAQLGDTMGRLAERLGVRGNALTQAADRLVNHSLAERLSDPHDRRIVRLRLTERGREWVGERRARRRERLSRLWELLTPLEREELLRAVCTLDDAGERLAVLSAHPVHEISIEETLRQIEG